MEERPETLGEAPRPRPERARSRAPIVAFGAVEVLALTLWLYVGRSRWFYIDEWDFLAGRSAGSAHDVFRPHNGHWTTLPVLAYRGLYALFGLRTYVPYRVMIIVLYLVAAALLRAVMRRACVHPWIATAAASFFALFGAGWENILLPFQIAFVGSLTFGLAALLVTDHDGPRDRRDALGLGFGLLALMCSAVGVVMVAVVGGSILLRRGRRDALLHVLPLAACYAVWLLSYGRSQTGVGNYTARDVIGFLRTGFVRSFEVVGPVAGFGYVAALLLAGGLVASTRTRRRQADQLEELAAPLALLLGSCALLAITAANRAAFGADWARQSRYVSLVVAMLLPALAVAADALARRWRAALPFAVTLFLVGIPINIHAASQAQRTLDARDRATRATMLSLPRFPLARAVPGAVKPEPTTAGEVTIGWLLDAAAHLRLPASPAITDRLRASDEFRLSFERGTGTVPSSSCRESDGPLVLTLVRGDRIGGYDNGVFLAPADGSLVGPPLLFDVAQPLEVLRDVGRVRVRPVLPGRFRICRATM